MAGEFFHPVLVKEIIRIICAECIVKVRTYIKRNGVNEL